MLYAGKSHLTHLRTDVSTLRNVKKESNVTHFPGKVFLHAVAYAGRSICEDICLETCCCAVQLWL